MQLYVTPTPFDVNFTVAVKIYYLYTKIIVTDVINCDLCDYQTETTHSNSKALCSEAIIYELWFKSDTKKSGTKCYVILLLSTATKHYFHRQTCAMCHAIFVQFYHRHSMAYRDLSQNT